MKRAADRRPGRHVLVMPAPGWVLTYLVGVAYVATSALYLALRLAA